MQKTKIAALSMSALVASAAVSARANTYDTTVESYNPLAYYNFDNVNGTQTTSAVNGYTLTLENGATVTAGAGPVVNGAAIPGLVLANGSSGTAYATSTSPSGLMGKIGTTGTILATIDLASLPSTYGRIYSIAGESQFGDDFDLQIDTDNTIDFYTNSGGAATTAALTNADIGQNLFLAAVLNGNTADIYIDGVLAATASTGGRYDSGNPFYVGQSNVFGGRYFDGVISDVALYNTALTTTQVSAIYASASAIGTSAVPEPGTWALMLLGFGLIGFAARSVRRQNIRVAYA